LGVLKHIKEIRNISIDNQGAIALARNPEFHARTKHFDSQYHFIQEHIEKRQIELTYCHRSEITADIFTKALPQPAFTKHNLALGLIDISVQIQQSVNSDTIDFMEEAGSTGEGRYCSITGTLPILGSFTVQSSTRGTMRVVGPTWHEGRKARG